MTSPISYNCVKDPSRLWALKPSAVTYRTRFRIRRHRCPCLYYSNSTWTFHPLLIGDLFFKLNPGPVNGTIPTIAFVRGSRKRCGSLRHPQNLININISDPNTRSSGNFNHPLSVCPLNARSVKNKTALILDYIRDYSADLYAITETWLTDKDASVKEEFCPAGYNFIDYPWTGYRDGGTGLNFRDSLPCQDGWCVWKGFFWILRMACKLPRL